MVRMSNRLPVSKYLRSALHKAYKGKCQYCGAVPDSFTIDHIIPFARGGADDITNLTLACSPCNLRKAALLMDPMFISIAHARATQ
jgi:5-methylcytosine-specific restriction endonuclease McrA